MLVFVFKPENPLSGTITVRSLGDGTLQYDIGGKERPPFKRMIFKDDGVVKFADIHTAAVLPTQGRAELTKALKDLQTFESTGNRRMLGVDSEEKQIRYRHQNQWLWVV